MAVLLQSINDPLPRPSEFVKAIPKQVEQVIFKALAKNPKDRYANMREFVRVLEQLSGGKRTGSFLDGWIKATSEKQEVTINGQTMDTGSLSPKDGNNKIIGSDSDARNPDIQTPSKERKNSIKWYWMMIAGIGIMAIAFLSFQILKTFSPQSTKNGPATSISTPQSTLTENAAQNPSIGFTPQVGSVNYSPKDGVELVYIPAGKFIMGEKVGVNLNNYPQHEVNLNNYWIYKTPVTNKQYKKCVKEGVCSPPGHINSRNREYYYDNAEYSDYPVISVTWDQARTYCRWAGMKLPTEAQWEKAARGTDGRTYPWGNEIPVAAKIFASVNSKDTVKVGGFPQGESPFGLLDMGGNVWEWVADLYDEDYYSKSPLKNPVGPVSGSKYVLRGGPLNVDEGYNKTTIRKGDDPSEIDTSYGFRCAIEAIAETNIIPTPIVDKQSKQELPPALTTSTAETKEPNYIPTVLNRTKKNQRRKIL